MGEWCLAAEPISLSEASTNNFSAGTERLLVMDTSNLVVLFSDNLTKLVFKEILKNRTVLFKDIRDSVQKHRQNSALVDEPHIEKAVNLLKNADLIKERPAVIGDFSSYYVTANGLNAERQLRLVETTSTTA